VPASVSEGSFEGRKQEKVKKWELSHITINETGKRKTCILFEARKGETKTLKGRGRRKRRR
jgi:hypothetical protein